MVALLQFLNHILPPEGQGYRCWAAIKDKRLRVQKLVATNEELSLVLKDLDTRKFDAYFACSSFTDLEAKKPREQVNVHSVKSFWLDIDVGIGKPYATYAMAREALDEFQKKVDLPLPTIVCSGSGIHAYWTLETSISGKEWTRTAENLKALTHQYFLEADDSRTADRSSILRPIQTLNWKNPDAPKEVYLDGDLQPCIPNAVFMAKINPATLPAISDEGISEGILGGLDAARPQEPSLASLAVLRCKQLDSFRLSGGNVGEELWYANLGVLAHCTDGEELGHEWSKGYSGYSEAETTAKLAHARNDAGPTTCAKFKKLNSKGCEGCPFSVTSPIQLGKKPDLVVPPKIEADRVLWLPQGFQWGNNLQIMAQVKDPTSDKEDPKFMLVQVCAFPFQIDAWRVDETKGTAAGSQSVKFSQRTPHTGWTDFTMDVKTLFGANWIAELAGMGIRCNTGMERHFRLLINKMIEARGEAGMPEIAYSSNGWKDARKKFVVGHNMIRKGEPILTVSGTGEFEKKAGLIGKPMGDFQTWRGLANKLFTPGCESQAFAFLCSFAAPIMDLLFGVDEGGGIVSLVSAGSGRGKSTMLAAVESVWGNVTGLRITEAASFVAKFRAIGIYKNLPVVIDEWGDADPIVTREIVATFTGGLDKDRLTQHGFSTRERLSWRTIMIGSTNRPIVDQLRSSNDHPQANRIFEVRLEVPDYILQSHSATLNKAFEKNNGWAGPMFISHLMENFNLDELEVKANALLETFAKQLQVTNDFRFNLRVITACAIAAKILTTPGKNGEEPMLDFSASNIINWALKKVADNAANKGGRTTYEEHISEFIRDNMHNFVVVNGPYNPKVPTSLYNRPRVSLMGRYEKKSERLYIPQDIIRKFALKVKVPYAEFADCLIGTGFLLQRNRQTSLTVGVEEMTPNRASCWEIDASHPAIKGELEDLVKDMVGDLNQVDKGAIKDYNSEKPGEPPVK